MSRSQVEKRKGGKGANTSETNNSTRASHGAPANNNNSINAIRYPSYPLQLAQTQNHEYQWPSLRFRPGQFRPRRQRRRASRRRSNCRRSRAAAERPGPALSQLRSRQPLRHAGQQGEPGERGGELFLNFNSMQENAIRYVGTFLHEQWACVWCVRSVGRCVRRDLLTGVT